MEVTHIHHHNFDSRRDLLKVEYSIYGDAEDTTREISLLREDFTEFYPFGETIDIYETDDSHYELDTEFEFDEENFKIALTEYLMIYEEELTEINTY